MKKAKCDFIIAVNDILQYDGIEHRFVERLTENVYFGIIKLQRYMSRTMTKRILNIAESVTTIIAYRLYTVNGRKNEQCAQNYINQFKCLRVLCDNLCQCITIHDLPDEILNKVETIGKPLFNFINKKY